MANRLARGLQLAEAQKRMDDARCCASQWKRI